MAPLFENSYIRDESILLEFNRRFRLFSPVYILYYLFSAYCLYQFVTLLIFWGVVVLRFLLIPVLHGPACHSSTQPKRLPLPLLWVLKKYYSQSYKRS